ncbi:unnamed protein product [Urochloa humidicola]
MEHQKSKSMELDGAMWQSARLQAAASDELGQSCRVYCPATGRVPFEWEDEPLSPAMQSARIAGRRDRRRKVKQSNDAGAADGFEGCIPLRFSLGRAMKRWV